MNKAKIITGTAIVILLIFNVIVLIEKTKLEGQVYALSKNNGSHWKYNLIANYNSGNTTLDNLSIVDKSGDRGFNDVMGDNPHKFIFFYSDVICDVCEKDIFTELRSFQNFPFYDNIIVLLPLQSYRDFKRHNEEYGLGLKHVFAYKDSILTAQKDLVRGSFFIMGQDLIVKDIYVPNKPIDKNNFNDYMKRVIRKYGL